MEFRIHAEAEATLELALEINQDFLVFLLQAIEHVGIEHHTHLAHEPGQVRLGASDGIRSFHG